MRNFLFNATLGALLLASGCMTLRPGRAQYDAHPVPSTWDANGGVAGTIFRSSTGPLAYQAPTLKDVGPQTQMQDVSGQACQSGIGLPLGILNVFGVNLPPPTSTSWVHVEWGAGGYQSALQQAHEQMPGSYLYDVRADLNFKSILGIWRQQCVVVHASAFVPGPGTSQTPSSNEAPAPTQAPANNATPTNPL